MSTQSQVTAFLQSKGLTGAQIAGILGNIKVESGFRTSAHNPQEGAIGLVQWEGGRRTALQRFAAKRGTSETDLDTQLNFMWSELSGPYSHALKSIRSSNNPADAAAAWDSQYEISAGTTRSQRINYANQFYSGGLNKIPGGQASASSANYTGQAGASGGGGTAKAAPPDYSKVDGLGGLLKQVPELKGLLSQAQAGGWTIEKFENEVENSKWWKSNADTARQQAALAAQDPATFAQNVKTMQDHVKRVAASLGVKLTGEQIRDLAHQGLYEGATDEALQYNIGNSFLRGGSKGAGSGQSADYDAQIRAMATEYGIPMSNGTVNAWVRNALTTGSISGAQSYIINAAKSTYSGIAGQINDKTSTRDLAGTYIDTMAQTLELDPDAIKLSDPTIQRALQTKVGKTTTGTAVDKANNTDATAAANSSGTGAVPLYEFQQQLRDDPRWQKTKNARESAFTMLHGLGQSFGFTN